jgi:hypothetical protein
MADDKLERNENSLHELHFVEECLRDAGAYQLTAEVVTWALKAMKAHPEFSVQEAMERGMEEWDV